MAKKKFSCFLLIAFLFTARLSADSTTQPVDPNAARLTFLGDQISADEAAIKAIDHALTVAGYQVSVASHTAENAAKGNEIMDRNGGGPVAWQDFYGRTARSFIVRNDFDNPQQLKRPPQFNYVYRANNDKIEQAQNDIHALGNQIDALLARRTQIETEESSLWATIAFESIGNRNIPLRPLYRDQLKSKIEKDPKADAMRAAVLYMRTVDHTVSQLSGMLETQQGVAYVAVRDTLDKALQSLQDAAANFADVSAGNPAEVKQMMDVLGQAKSIQSFCKDICESYQKAQDAGLAKEEQRKELYRGTLQDSLFKFAESCGNFDDTLEKMSRDANWGVFPQPGTKTSDTPLAIIMPNGQPATQPAPAPVPAVVQNEQALAVDPAGKRIVDLLKLFDPNRDVINGRWLVEQGHLECTQSSDHARVEFPYLPPEEYDYKIVLIRTAGKRAVSQICSAGGTQFVSVVGAEAIRGHVNGFEIINGKHLQDNINANKGDLINNGQRFSMPVKVRRDHVEAYFDSQLISQAKTDYSNLKLPPEFRLRNNGALGIEANDCTISVESAQIVEITGQGKNL